MPDYCAELCWQSLRVQTLANGTLLVQPSLPAGSACSCPATSATDIGINSFSFSLVGDATSWAVEYAGLSAGFFSLWNSALSPNAPSTCIYQYAVATGTIFGTRSVANTAVAVTLSTETSRCPLSICQKACFKSYNYISYTLPSKEVIGTLVPPLAFIAGASGASAGCSCYTPLIYGNASFTSGFRGVLDAELGTTPTSFVADIIDPRRLNFSLASCPDEDLSASFAMAAIFPTPPTPTPKPPSRKKKFNCGIGCAVGAIAGGTVGAAIAVIIGVTYYRRRAAAKAAREGAPIKSSGDMEAAAAGEGDVFASNPMRK